MATKRNSLFTSGLQVSLQKELRPNCLNVPTTVERGSRMFNKVKRQRALDLKLDISASASYFGSDEEVSNSMDVIQHDSSDFFQASTTSSIKSHNAELSDIFTGGDLTPDPFNVSQPVFQSCTENKKARRHSFTTINTGICSELQSSDRVKESHTETDEELPVQVIDSIITLQECGDLTYAFDHVSKSTFTCKILKSTEYRELLFPYFALSYDLAFLHLDRIIEESNLCYALFELPLGGDLHSYIRLKKRLKEDEAKRLIEPIFKLIAECHACNFICRDIKLRKCVFLDVARTQLVYQGLEDGRQIAERGDDVIYDRVGCPAYASPEVVQSTAGYSGRAADMWGLGVVLYTMLVGRYPFQTSSSRDILQQVRRGEYHLPSWLSLQARCLLRSLLCVEPAARISATEALNHAWFRVGVKTTPRPVPTGFRPAGRSGMPSSAKEKGKPVAPPDCVFEAECQVPDEAQVAAFSGFL